jgi:hypothetical protein
MIGPAGGRGYADDLALVDAIVRGGGRWENF